VSGYGNKTLQFKITLFLFLCQFASIYAQVNSDSNFSRKDSLRGHLNPLRSCYDVKFYDLSIQIDPGSKSIKGSNHIFMKSTDEFQKIQLDLFSNMAIDSVVYNDIVLPIEREENAFYVHFPDMVNNGKFIYLSIYYHGIPIIAKYPPWDGGFVWEKDSLNRDWIGVSCQGIGASLWWPNKDHLSDRPDSMRISLDVPEKLTAVSNGKLLETISLDNGKKRWIWKVSYPINNYNVSINIGHYSYFSEMYRSLDGNLDLNYYVLDYNLDKAKKQFEQVKSMLMCYEHFFGSYPFINDGYKLVETPYYGMEHQSGIAYGNNYENNDFNFDYIIIHESGHEYWGNSISINDLGELWVHESFTTYMESLYIEYFHGRNTAIEYIELQKEEISNQRPMLGPLEVNYDNWMGTDIYYKGVWMLHSIRNTINDDSIWFELLKDTYQKFKYQTVTSNDIIHYMDANSDYDLKPIFNNFLTNENPPVLRVKEKRKKGRIELIYSWKDVKKDFNMPVDVRYGKENIRLFPTVKKKKQFLDELDGLEPQYATDLFYFVLDRK
jgi:aminopeptidase N